MIAWKVKFTFCLGISMTYTVQNTSAMNALIEATGYLTLEQKETIANVEIERDITGFVRIGDEATYTNGVDEKTEQIVSIKDMRQNMYVYQASIESLYGNNYLLTFDESGNHVYSGDLRL
jgi:hypothetical protein